MKGLSVWNEWFRSWFDRVGTSIVSWRIEQVGGGVGGEAGYSQVELFMNVRETVVKSL